MSRSSSATRPFHLIFRPHSSPCITRSRSSSLISSLRSRDGSLRQHPTTEPALRRPPSRAFSSTHTSRKGLQPSTPDPEPPQTSSSPAGTTAPMEPSPLSNESYHELADSYLDRLVSALEEKAETNTEYEVEYSAGVLSVELPQGTWIINKQPPNKQIWLSSPLSGPKRYDYVAVEDGGAAPTAAAAQNEKQGTEGGGAAVDYEDGGRWVYLRDGSGLSDLLRKEVGVVVPPPDGEA